MNFLKDKLDKIYNCESIEEYINLLNKEEDILKISRDKIKSMYPSISDYDNIETLYYIFLYALSSQLLYTSMSFLSTSIEAHQYFYKRDNPLVDINTKCYNNINIIEDYFKNFDNIDNLIKFLEVNDFAHFAIIHKISLTKNRLDLYIKISSYTVKISHYYDLIKTYYSDRSFIKYITESKYYDYLWHRLECISRCDDIHIIGGNTL